MAQNSKQSRCAVVD